jgi:hypothetical protein
MPKRQPNEEKAAGLYIIGIISARSKRQVPKDNPQHEVVTYLIKSETGRNYYVDEFDPQEYYAKGESVEIPVYVKPYVNQRTGTVGYSLSVLKDDTQDRIQGEQF